MRAPPLVRHAALAVAGLAASAVPSTAGTFQGLEPGMSRKADADHTLGTPVLVLAEGVRYDYDPTPLRARRISVELWQETGLIKAIDLYPSEQYRTTDYRRWFRLGQPSITRWDADGDLVEYYPAEGLSLHLDGPTASAPVRFFRHFDPTAGLQTTEVRIAQERPPGDVGTARPPSSSPTTAPYTLEQYIAEGQQYEREKRWPMVRYVFEQGLHFFPDSAQLWSLRAHYFFYDTTEPTDVRRSEILRSARRAYELDPSTSRSIDLGWVYYFVFDDCISANLYFEQASGEFGREKPELYYYMGVCYERAADYDRAVACYRRFLNEASDHPEVGDARERLDRLTR